MRADRRWPFRLVVVLVLVVTGWFVLDDETPDPVSREPDAAEQPPDFYMEEFTVTTTGADGEPRYRLAGPRMEHFRGRDEWLLDEPRVTYFTDSGQPWKLRAEHGRAWNNVKDAHLSGEVTIRRQAGADHPPANVDTREVSLKPQQRYAETEARAVYWQANNRLEGVGLEAWFNREQMNLLSEVESEYEIPD